MRTTRSLRPGALRKGKKFLRMLATFAMKRKNDLAIPTAQVKSVTFLLFFLHLKVLTLKFRAVPVWPL